MIKTALIMAGGKGEKIFGLEAGSLYLNNFFIINRR